MHKLRVIGPCFVTVSANLILCLIVFVYVFEGQYGYSAVMDNTWHGTIIGTYPTIVTYPQDKRIIQAEKAALMLCLDY